MRFTSLTRQAFILAITASFVTPQVPYTAFAQNEDKGKPTFDLFPEDSNKNNPDGLFPSVPTIPKSPGNATSNPTNNSGNNNNNRNNPINITRPSTAVRGATMAVAKVPEAYSCPLFENRPHAELIQAIDSLSAQVKASQECTDDPSAQSISASTRILKENVISMSNMLDTQDASSINTAMIEQNMTAALGAVNNLGEVLNNNSFLNSACGRQTMSTGKALLALNDMVNGLAPYALFAVAANAALAPALPYVVGAALATTGINILGKMLDQGNLDMNNPNHRLAVLQNTCQFTKVAKKVRFMQLAQSGKIEKITEELERSVDLYRAQIKKPSTELTSLLKYRQTVVSSIGHVEKQLEQDQKDMEAVITQTSINDDDLMICTLSRELVNWGQDNMTFPSSVFNNLQNAANVQNERTLKLQAATFRSVHNSSMQKIIEFADQAYNNRTALRNCAQVGRSWITSMNQAVKLTSDLITSTKFSLESELNQNTEYRQFMAQYNQIRIEQTTIQRVEKAMRELARDNSIIDRSELAQRMTLLKNGLFGTRKIWKISEPPVMQWIDHTKTIHDRAISGFLIGWKALQSGAYSLTASAQGKAVKRSANGGMIPDLDQQVKDLKQSTNLETFNLRSLPQGSLENERACQQLEGAWLDWSASLDHLGAIQFFCDMIDPVLDVKMDKTVVNACRGNAQLNGRVSTPSLVNAAKHILKEKGYQNYANIVSAKLKELKCPVPAISVMNE